MTAIAEIQDKKEAEILKKYTTTESQAAKLLQRTYRGHRERRQLQGLSLDPTTRWTEAIKEAQYRNLTTPRARTPKAPQDGPNRTTSGARQNWSRIGKIARRAGGDEESSLSSSDNDTFTPTQKEARQRKQLAEKQERSNSAMMMDLSYFLEMVDVKHRYGSNLRKYHAEWKSRPTNENFFYWLDQGEGKDVEVEKCSRERLEHMQVRYLGREERRYYEVIVDKEGKLCWRKDGMRIDTSAGYRDSIHGIVKVDDPTPEWAHRPATWSGSSESSGISSEEEHSDKEMDSTTNSPNLPTSPKTPTSPTSPGAYGHGFLRNTIWRSGETEAEKKAKKKKKKQKWIFVADIYNNLYIGIKQSGAFQHSSFLHGSRVSAAGLITVKNGKLKILQPRSGHYRTPSHNLHILIKSFQSRGVDMSTTAVGSTYAAMVGIETFMKTRGKIRGLKAGFRSLNIGRDGKGSSEKEKG